ncbi:MAG: hypothetical protein IPI67_33260 [Myxococcales bacterium]|nr:hypothetical protein [Myxococcales bacterium]
MRTVAHTRWLGGVLVVVSPFVLVWGCPGGGDATAGGGGSAAGTGTGGANQDGSGGEPWDPVWHENKPKDWPVVGPEQNPDCGPGCRVALNLPMTNPAAYGHAFTTGRVLAIAASGLAHVAVGATPTTVLPHPADAPRIEPSIWSDHVLSARSFGIGNGEVQLTSLVTGETKVVFRYEPPDSGASASELTALNSKYAFFIYNGFRARNLQTGELKYLGPGACYSLCATETAFICESGKIYLVDPETGSQQKIDDGTELQFDGSCSADRKQYTWIDYRDPPGPGSSAFITRSGGELYWHDFTSKATKRGTFDSPGKPRAKVFPAIGDGLAVWSEPPMSAADPNPSDYGDYYGISTALATLDLATGKRCQLQGDTPGLLSFKSVHGRHVYGGWFDSKSVKTWLVDVDLDHPSLQWSCVMTPGWGQ